MPVSNGVILSSNRDEKKERSIALPPKKYVNEGKALFYPTDTKANGTWFITNEKGNAGVLLNGAAIAHEPKPSYKASRGSILPQIFSSANPIQTLQKLELNDIENFTLILYINQLLFECSWNGSNLNLLQKCETTAHIWSSVTLYSDEMITQRETWFTEWLHGQTKEFITQEEVVSFHVNGGADATYRFKMNRDNYLLTVSITSVAINNDFASLYYYDCLEEKKYIQKIDLIN